MSKNRLKFNLKYLEELNKEENLIIKSIVKNKVNYVKTTCNKASIKIEIQEKSKKEIIIKLTIILILIKPYINHLIAKTN